MNTAQQIQSSPATAAGFDLDDVLSGALTEVTYPVVLSTDDEGEPMTGLIIVGKNSPQYQAANNSTRIANIQRASKRKNAIDTSTEAGAQVVAATMDNNEHETAVAVVVGWFGFHAKGTPVAFDHKYVDPLLTKNPAWRVLVTAALDKDANFTKV